MSKVVYVAIHYGVNERGYVAYDTESQALTVSLPDPAWADKVRTYLETPQEIHHAVGLNTYENRQITGTNSAEDLRLVLTRMWDAIRVQVDWSRPAEVDGELKFHEL